jgi:putative addiction module killer protein
MIYENGLPLTAAGFCAISPQIPLDNMGIIVYIMNMKVILRSSVYKKWIKNLRDTRARARILTRTKRLAEGNSGDNRFLGGISEMRIDYGPGYRVYFKDTGKEIIILLCGGDKSTQEADIARAREIANIPMEEDEEG